MNTPEQWHKNRIKPLLDGNLFNELIKTPNVDIMKLSIESQDVQLIDLTENKINTNNILKIKTESNVYISKSDSQLLNIKQKDPVTLNLKEYNFRKTLTLKENLK